MALTFNPYLKSNTTGILAALKSYLESSATLYIYPTTVALPAVGATTLPPGYLLSITGSLTSFTTNGTDTITNNAVMTANPTGGGTFAWWAFGTIGSDLAKNLWSDSIGLNGSGNILTVSTMTPTLGQAVTAVFTLKMI
jgi:hypothetical protein